MSGNLLRQVTRIPILENVWVSLCVRHHNPRKTRGDGRGYERLEFAEDDRKMKSWISVWLFLFLWLKIPVFVFHREEQRSRMSRRMKSDFELMPEALYLSSSIWASSSLKNTCRFTFHVKSFMRFPLRKCILCMNYFHDLLVFLLLHFLSFRCFFEV